MKNKALRDIAEFAKKSLQATYGFCGTMTNDNTVILNSDDRNGNDIKIIITLKKED